jgi:hypothetical protein
MVQPSLLTDASLSFKGKCHHCGRVGHMQRHCQKKRRDEQNGKRSEEKGPAAALVCKITDMSNVALVVSGSSSEDGVMLYDSCCTHHLVNDRKFLSELRPSDVKCMRMGGNEAHRVEGQGTAVLIGGPIGRVILQNVLYVPTMIHNLFSRGQAYANALARGAKEEADGKGFVIRRKSDNAVILTGSTGGLSAFHLRLEVLSPSASDITSATTDRTSEWGYRSSSWESLCSRWCNFIAPCPRTSRAYEHCSSQASCSQRCIYGFARV